MKMIKSAINRVCIGITVLGTSCTTYIHYPVQIPPAIETYGQHKKIAFVNHYDYTNLPYENKNKKDVFVSGARKLIENLEGTFGTDENFQLIMQDTLAKSQ